MGIFFSLVDELVIVFIYFNFLRRFKIFKIIKIKERRYIRYLGDSRELVSELVS